MSVLGIVTRGTQYRQWRIQYLEKGGGVEIAYRGLRYRAPNGIMGLSSPQHGVQGFVKVRLIANIFSNFVF